MKESKLKNPKRKKPNPKVIRIEKLVESGQDPEVNRSLKEIQLMREKIEKLENQNRDLITLTTQKESSSGAHGTKKSFFTPSSNGLDSQEIQKAMRQ